MNISQSEARDSLLSELLLYHAALGRGYISPFPATQGMVFSSCLPHQAMSALASAESDFRRWHEDRLAQDRQFLAQVEEQSQMQASMAAVTGITKAKIKEVSDRVAKYAHVTWREDQTLKSTIVELLKNHFYGSFTYVDPVGARIGTSLTVAAKLAGDLGWVTLMEGTTDQTFIRATAKGGALVHTLTGLDPSFNFFSSCKEQHLLRLMERIKETPSGQVGLGTTIVLPGSPGIFSGAEPGTLLSLMRRVFALGAEPVDSRVKVVFDPTAAEAWRKFLNWTLVDILGVEELPAWQVKLSTAATASVRTSVLFGARAALVAAFLQVAEQNESPIREVTLRFDHLTLAMNAAKLIYYRASGQAGYEKRQKNLKDPKETFITPHRLAIAQTAIEEALRAAPNRRLSRTYLRRSVPGVTLGLLDELVSQGKIAELRGADECQMGQCKLAYTLSSLSPGYDVQDSVDEFDEASQDFADFPDAFSASEALSLAVGLREKAATLFAEHYLPAVPVSRMTKQERRMLPRILAMYPQSFLLRGAHVGIDEPAVLLADADTPLDVAGLNLWVRYRPDGQPFCDWKRAGKLRLSEQWDDHKQPTEVSA